jgi:hypothetical protein
VRGANHSPPSITKVQNDCSLHLYSPLYLHGMDRDNCTLIFHFHFKPDKTLRVISLPFYLIYYLLSLLQSLCLSLFRRIVLSASLHCYAISAHVMTC